MVRHAAHAHLGRVLSGRTPGISLSRDGRAQALMLARRLESLPIHRLQSSPVQRAVETAEAMAESRSALVVEVVDALDELDFGDWSGRAFLELADDPDWHAWNAERASAVAPNGESMAEAQERAWDHIQRTAVANTGGVIAMVTHCDIIRGVVARVLGLSLDNIHRFDIDPASVSRLLVGEWGARVLSVNEGGDRE
jgi:ribonuclease H / adenosylcobalamin/alpha-ribazole phosphatase